MTRKNFDHRLFSLMRTITDIVQICYAERMGKIYVLGTNWFYHMMFRIISPLLSKKTREKVCVLKGELKGTYLRAVHRLVANTVPFRLSQSLPTCSSTSTRLSWSASASTLSNSGRNGKNYCLFYPRKLLMSFSPDFPLLFLLLLLL